MGTPNNQNDSALRDILAKVVTASLNNKVPEAELHQHGADIMLLEHTYTRHVKPYLKYLEGYRSIGDHEGFNDIMGYGTASSGLMRFKDMQALLLLDVELVPKEASTHTRVVKVWLLRDGTWIGWTAQKYRDAGQFAENPYSDDYVHVCKSVAELCTVFEVTGSYYVKGRTQRHLPRYLPLMIECELHRVMTDTVDERQRRLSSIENARDQMSVYSERVSFPAF
ncbi:hypothetical protein KI440_03900 [Candidatus Saccharibacteria bacterium TM7i]|nr:hypothetical protein KI440_03900 [Candidatus Saccharibacteria bacterium TM7i]